jgi:hypothetical protein
MTDQERQQRAALFREQPGSWILLLYAGAFLGCAVANDLLAWATGTAPSHLQRYLLPLVLALPMWLAIQGWARRAPVGSDQRRDDRSPPG